MLCNIEVRHQCQAVCKIVTESREQIIASLNLPSAVSVFSNVPSLIHIENDNYLINLFVNLLICR